ncbi:hypothetical protein [Vibrio aestuarianus]|uniref:hypothetical protein n=1 Tax=Vibrio aestuarianus TaxID=28171 RepID=UPI00237D0368|nr:hypothetical protein [Vibrio aestuarianus]MDE1330438.1 hypothetical protein [Vibrio aestuarianus]
MARKVRKIANTSVNIKKHKCFRGIRCWFSAQIKNRHSSIVTSTSADRIIDRLCEGNHRVALISFGKSKHSAVVIRYTDDQFIYASMYGNLPRYRNKVNREWVRKVINLDMDQWKDGVDDNNLVLFSEPALDIEKIAKHISSNIYKYRFNPITKNCSRFAADALIAGYKGSREKLKHDRPFLMPANALQLAKEIEANQSPNLWNECSGIVNLVT